MVKNKQKLNYDQQLLTDEWEQKRQEVFKQDNYTCQICFKSNDNLEVHHKKYIKGRSAWEYKNRELITLCHKCHENYHKELKVTQFMKFLIINISKCKL